MSSSLWSAALEDRANARTHRRAELDADAARANRMHAQAERGHQATLEEMRKKRREACAAVLEAATPSTASLTEAITGLNDARRRATSLADLVLMSTSQNGAVCDEIRARGTLTLIAQMLPSLRDDPPACLRTHAVTLLRNCIQRMQSQRTIASSPGGCPPPPDVIVTALVGALAPGSELVSVLALEALAALVDTSVACARVVYQSRLCAVLPAMLANGQGTVLDAAIDVVSALACKAPLEAMMPLALSAVVASARASSPSTQLLSLLAMLAVFDRAATHLEATIAWDEWAERATRDPLVVQRLWLTFLTHKNARAHSRVAEHTLTLLNHLSVSTAAAERVLACMARHSEVSEAVRLTLTSGDPILGETQTAFALMRRWAQLGGATLEAALTGPVLRTCIRRSHELDAAAHAMHEILLRTPEDRQGELARDPEVVVDLARASMSSSDQRLYCFLDSCWILVSAVHDDPIAMRTWREQSRMTATIEAYLTSFTQQMQNNRISLEQREVARSLRTKCAPLAAALRTPCSSDNEDDNEERVGG